MKNHLVLIGDFISLEYLNDILFDKIDYIHILWTDTIKNISKIKISNYIKNKIKKLSEDGKKIILYNSIYDINKNINCNDKIYCFTSIKIETYQIRKIYKFFNNLCKDSYIINNYNKIMSK